MRAKDRQVNPATGLPVSKLSLLVGHMLAGEWDKALALANAFPRLGEHEVAIRRGHEAVVRTDFQRQLGRDPVALRDAGIAALEARYAEALQAARLEKARTGPYTCEECLGKYCAIDTSNPTCSHYPKGRPKKTTRKGRAS